MLGKPNRNNLILPFILAFCLTSLFVWLFLPFLFRDEPTSTNARNGAEAVAILMSGDMPEHVFFGSRAHRRDACNECHTFGEKEYLDIFKLQKQVKEGNGKEFYRTEAMSMAECIRCHAIPEHKSTTTAGEACGTCHR